MESRNIEVPNLQPVVLCHAAASGGSLIYRMIGSRFGMAGVSEASHSYRHESGRFIPTDPEYALLEAGVIDSDEFATVFIDRILNSIDLAARKGKRLLIREHTHSYFFNNPSIGASLSCPSWIAEQLEARGHSKLKCIVSVRDPVDSWLGLKANLAASDFLEFGPYCECYRTFIERCESGRATNDVLMVKYEDVVVDKLEIMRKVSEFIDEQFNPAMIDDWHEYASTGLSGRQSNVLHIRRRRPFDANLMASANHSKDYEYLADTLNYPRVYESSTTWERVRALLLPVIRPVIKILAQVFYRLDQTFHKWRDI